MRSLGIHPACAEFAYGLLLSYRLREHHISSSILHPKGQWRGETLLSEFLWRPLKKSMLLRQLGQPAPLFSRPARTAENEGRHTHEHANLDGENQPTDTQQEAQPQNGSKREHGLYLGRT